MIKHARPRKSRWTMILALGLWASMSFTCKNQEPTAQHTQDMTHKHTNALAQETSPYLLQHQHNPVDWMPWGDAALKKAKDEDKMMIVSVGYSACHWCHVMEHETFEDSLAAAYMNEHFVCIKVDREERPDIDQVYMNAVQIMTQSGGWPLNCFTLPDGRPFYGGTYFRKDQWMDLMKQLVDLRKNDPTKVEDYASQLTEGVRQSELIAKVEGDVVFDPEWAVGLVDTWSKYWDKQEGGPNRAPKFPLPNNFEFLLQYAWQYDDQKTEKYVMTTLDKMYQGGIYDQIGGGFARYSTDAIWKAPHFEKMLYDNAQLVSLYALAYKKTKNEAYKNVVFETLEFVKRELTAPEGVFYSALDADSEGEEGKFYVWQKAELENALGADFELAKDYWNINNKGLWEHGNYILLRRESDVAFAEQHKMELAALEEKVANWKKTLMALRDQRIRPGLDDKSLTSWNALMIKGYVDAYTAFGDVAFLKAAEKAADFIWEKQRQADGAIFHNYKGGRTTINGYLEDYCFTAEAFLALYEATFDEHWIDKAKQTTDYAIAHFTDEKTGMFWFTSDADAPLVARKQELNDNVIAGSNSSMAKVLFRLGTVLGEDKYKLRAGQMLANILPHTDYGQSYSNWAMLHLWHARPFMEVAITGPEVDKFRADFQATYMPNVMFLGGKNQSNLPLLEGKFLDNSTLFVCRNKSCKLPVESVSEARAQIEK